MIDNELYKFLKSFADHDTEIKTISTFSNYVFYLELKKQGIYVKFCGEHSDSNKFIKEKKILTILQDINPALSIPKLVKEFPSEYNGAPLIATYEIPGKILRNVSVRERTESLISWIRVKKVLHETNLDCDLAKEMTSNFEPMDDMYLYFSKQWKIGLLNSRFLAPKIIDKALQHIDGLIQSVSHGYRRCLIQGDGSLENAICNSDGSVSLIDFEKAFIGDPLWDIFGTVRDLKIIEGIEIAIVSEIIQNQDLNGLKRAIETVKALAAIKWLSSLSVSNKALKLGCFPGVTLDHIIKLGSEQLEYCTKMLD